MNIKYMDIAYEEAKKAFSINEVPVGAVIVYDNKILTKNHNTKRKENNVCNHAEILSIIDATKKLGDWRLSDCEMYITLEPCPMCAGAILNSRIKKIYIGAESNLKENKIIMYKILNNKELNHQTEIIYLKNEKCSKILTDFFSQKR